MELIGKIDNPAELITRPRIDVLSSPYLDVQGFELDRRKKITGEDFGPDATAWRSWWASKAD